MMCYNQSDVRTRPYLCRQLRGSSQLTLAPAGAPWWPRPAGSAGQTQCRSPANQLLSCEQIVYVPHIWCDSRLLVVTPAAIRTLSVWGATCRGPVAFQCQHLHCGSVGPLDTVVGASQPRRHARCSARGAVQPRAATQTAYLTGRPRKCAVCGVRSTGSRATGRPAVPALLQQAQ
jgi:hypothetical protein